MLSDCTICGLPPDVDLLFWIAAQLPGPEVKLEQSYGKAGQEQAGMPVKEESPVKGASRDADAAASSRLEGPEDTEMAVGANADEDLYREYQGDHGGASSCK